METPRPFVYVNMAMTADGKITSTAREYPRFTSKYDRLNMDRLRADADAILVGGGTLRADNPVLQVRDAAMLQQRLERGKPEHLIEVLVSASVQLPSSSRFLRETQAPRIVATVEQADPARLDRLPGGVEVLRLGRDRVDLKRLLGALRDRGVERLLLEGGGELNWEFVRLDLIDELYVTVAPVLIGGREAPTLLGGTGFAMRDQVRLRLVELHREGDELYCRYAVDR